MTCVRHLERLWNRKSWGKLLRDLLADRPEASPRLQVDLNTMVAAAAMAMIRLDELCQTHARLFGELLRTLLALQEADGGWRDPMTTALCVRALLIDDGQGLAIDRALAYLANMQKNEGIWPREPLRRLPADAYASAYILFQLGPHPSFRSAVHIEAAVRWFDLHADELDADASRLWAMADLQCRAPYPACSRAPGSLLFS